MFLDIPDQSCEFGSTIHCYRLSHHPRHGWEYFPVPHNVGHPGSIRRTPIRSRFHLHASGQTCRRCAYARLGLFGNSHAEGQMTDDDRQECCQIAALALTSSTSRRCRARRLRIKWETVSQLQDRHWETSPID
jgi:hypothetical protein